MLFYHVSIFIFVIDVIEISQSTTNPNIVQGYFDLSNHGFEFITYDSQALILAEISQSMLTCIQKCNLIAHCRTFNYDTVIKYCRLYEGDADTTGSIVASLSSYLLYGSIRLLPQDFINYGHSCASCPQNRYLTCVNSTCQCQIHTYFDGFVCRSQKFNGSQCSSNIECRQDLNFTCSSNNQCSSKYIKLLYLLVSRCDHFTQFTVVLIRSCEYQQCITK